MRRQGKFHKKIIKTEDELLTKDILKSGDICWFDSNGRILSSKEQVKYLKYDFMEFMVNLQRLNSWGLQQIPERKCRYTN